MRLAGCLALLCSCATTPRYTSSPPTWTDTEETRSAIACALEKEYGPAIAARFSAMRVLVVPNYPLRGQTNGDTVILQAESKSARQSTWRHEAVHFGLSETTGERYAGGACARAKPFLDAEERFTASFRVCRRALLGLAPLPAPEGPALDLPGDVP